jgi:uncharacterized repeat protein (TIGR03803 family)
MLACLLLLSATAFASGPVEHILDSLPTTTASGPNGGLIADSAGNLYGTTRFGGNGYGTVFELSPPTTAGGAWTQT